MTTAECGRGTAFESQERKSDARSVSVSLLVASPKTTIMLVGIQSLPTFSRTLPRLTTAHRHFGCHGHRNDSHSGF